MKLQKFTNAELMTYRSKLLSKHIFGRVKVFPGNLPVYNGVIKHFQLPKKIMEAVEHGKKVFAGLAGEKYCQSIQLNTFGKSRC